MPAKIYKWEEWFTRRRFRLNRRVHYDCGQASIIQQIRNAASAYGVSVKIREKSNSIEVEVLTKWPAKSNNLAVPVSTLG